MRLGSRDVRLAVAGLVAVLGAASWAAWAQPPTTSAAVAQPRPNVVVIETDDQTVESMKVMAKVQSLIGEKGVTFANSFVNYSLCCPSRSTFLTGEYAHNHGVLGNHPPDGGFPRFERLHGTNNLAVWLKRAGYRTALVGKYLNGYGGGGTATRVPPGWIDWNAMSAGTAGSYYDYDLNQNGTLVHYGTDPPDYKGDVLTKRSVKVIDRDSRHHKPFFLWLTYKEPHTGGPNPSPQPPFDCQNAALPSPTYADAFDSAPLPTTPNFNEDDVSDKPQRIQDLPKLTQSDIADITRKYRCGLESLLSVDDGVKAVMDALKATGQLRNTYVIYTSDNGYFHGEHRIPKGKVTPYEESIRVPLLMRGPGIPHGVTARDLSVNADLAPTIVQLTGAKPKLTMDGRSLLPTAKDPRLERGRELSIEGTGFKGIRTQRYIFIQYSDGESELYDLKNDPYELQNVATDPTYHQVESVLAGRLRNLKRCSGKSCRRKPPVALRFKHASTVRGGHRCALNPVRARIAGGTHRDPVVRAEFYVRGRRIAVDTTAPFQTKLPPLQGVTPVSARVSVLDGRRITLERRLRACG